MSKGNASTIELLHRAGKEKTEAGGQRRSEAVLGQSASTDSFEGAERRYASTVSCKTVCAPTCITGFFAAGDALAAAAVRTLSVALGVNAQSMHQTLLSYSAACGGGYDTQRQV